MTNRILALLVALLALACEPAEITIAARPGLEADTFAALNAWNLAFERDCPSMRLTYVDDFDGADVQIAYGRVPGYDDGGVASETDRFVVVHPGTQEQWPELMPTIIAHELGHALGAHHTEDPGDLMRGDDLRPGRSPMPSRNDLAQVCNTWRNP